jgi:DNA-binding response OmpR family regulator
MSSGGAGTGAGKVLIVDDEPNIVTSLQFLLKKSGFTTAVARDGDAALAEAEAFRPDLVLLDVNLPHRDGFEVCQTLRAGGWRDLKIIMLTAKGRESEVTKGLEVGADAYITKPFSTRDLVQQVTRMLAGDD